LIVGEENANHTRCGVCGSLLFSVVRDGAFVHVAMGLTRGRPRPPSSTSSALQVVALGGFHFLIGVVWLTTYANLVGRLHLVLSREGVRRWLERATGAVLISFGFRVAFSRR